MKILSFILLFSLVACSTLTSNREPSSAKLQEQEAQHKQFQGVFDK
jgi:hypothetical protein